MSDTYIPIKKLSDVHNDEFYPLTAAKGTITTEDITVKNFLAGNYGTKVPASTNLFDILTQLFSVDFTDTQQLTNSDSKVPTSALLLKILSFNPKFKIRVLTYSQYQELVDNDTVDSDTLYFTTGAAPVYYWIVNFNANGGTCSETTRNVVKGSQYGTLPTPTYAGNTFQGWFTNVTGGTQVTATDSPTSNTTLYAHWTVTPTYYWIITFNPNGGTCSETTRNVERGTQYGALPVPTYTGNIFQGWFTSSSGGTKINSSDVPTQNTTLYAQWQTAPIGTATVTFNANGGICGETTRSVTKGNAIGTLPTASYSGKVFDGWYTSQSSGTKISSATIINNDVTYYAHYNDSPVIIDLLCLENHNDLVITEDRNYNIKLRERSQDTWRVTFDGNGGESSASYIDVTKGNAIGTLPTATRNGYTFNGWYTQSSGGTKILVTYVPTTNITVYAQWTIIPPQTKTVTFNANGGTCSETTRNVVVNTAIGTLPIPTFTGYSFVGWFTAITGGTVISKSSIVTTNVTLYAHWDNGEGSTDLLAEEQDKNKLISTEDMLNNIKVRNGSVSLLTSENHSDMMSTEDKMNNIKVGASLSVVTNAPIMMSVSAPLTSIKTTASQVANAVTKRRTRKRKTKE